MRCAALASVTLLAAGCRPASDPTHVGAGVAAAFDGSGGQWVDLTHPFSKATVYWPTDTLGFTLEQLAYGPTPGGFFCGANRSSGAEHGGTHLDAPIHLAEGRQAVEEIPLSSLIGPAAVDSFHFDGDRAVRLIYQGVQFTIEAARI